MHSWVNAQLPPLFQAIQLKIQRGNQTDSKLILAGDTQCSLQLQAGELCHLTGASGSGKSTLLTCFARLYPLVAGNLWLHGQAAHTLSPPEWRSQVALLPQTPVMLPGTLADNLRYPLQHLRMPQQRFKQLAIDTDETRLEQHLAQLDLTMPLTRLATELSGGQQARLALARVLLTCPQLLLADEPLAGLDADSATQVMRCLHDFCDNGGAVLMTAHSHVALLDSHSHCRLLPSQQLAYTSMLLT